MQRATNENDPVKVYLDQMSAIPPISPQEELQLGALIDEARGRWRQVLLEAPLAQRQALRFFERILSRDVPAKRVLHRELPAPELKAALTTLSERLRGTLAANEADFLHYLDDADGAGVRARIRRGMKARSGELIEQLEEWPLLPSHMSTIEQKLQERYERMKKLRRRRGRLRSHATEARLANMTDDLRQLTIELQQTPRGMSRYLRDVQAAREEYEDAKALLGRRNLRLVVSIAASHRKRGLPFLDLIQEGNTGLMKALDRFQVHRGYKFSTYATWWIRQTIGRGIANQSRTVRVPIHAVNELHRLQQRREDFLKREGREPSTAELADEAGIQPKRVQRLLDLSRTALSLDQPVGGESTMGFSDLLPDESLKTPVQQSQEAQLKERIDEALDLLTPRERTVLKMRFGLEEGTTYTLEEVGRVFNVSRERIRQIEALALQKMRLPVPRKRLIPFWREATMN